MSEWVIKGSQEEPYAELKADGINGHVDTEGNDIYYSFGVYLPNPLTTGTFDKDMDLYEAIAKATELLQIELGKQVDALLKSANQVRVPKNPNKSYRGRYERQYRSRPLLTSKTRKLIG